MKRWQKVGCVLAAVCAAFTVCVLADSWTVGNYWYMLYATGGSPTTWYNSTNSFGFKSNGGSGFAAMIVGCHWGTCSTDKILPTSMATAGNLRTWLTQSISGGSYDATYDIWVDSEGPNPLNRNADHEIMIWLQWVKNQPIATKYDANGQAIPTYSNQKIGNYTYDVFFRTEGGAGNNGPTMSFLLSPPSPSIDLRVMDIIDYCVKQGWMKNTWWVTSVQAGWEFGTGNTGAATAFGVSTGSPPVGPCDNLNCGAHGTCNNGVCICKDGYAGTTCTFPPGTDPCAGVACGAHGSCSNGACVCTDGFSGPTCSTIPCFATATDVGSNPYWFAFNIMTTVAGHSVKSVAVVKGSTTSTLTGPSSWGSASPAVYSGGAAAQTAPPFVLKVTDTTGGVTNLAVNAFGGSYSTCQ